MLKILGWKVILKQPAQKKYVIIAAPHTTNWDFFFFILLLWSTRSKFHWAAKHTIFKKPVGSILKKMGGIPIDRRIKNDYVNKIVELFNCNDEFVLVITPEGTRSKTEYWKAGFYYIARAANVPIMLGFIDYPSKTMGAETAFIPSSNLEKDLKLLRDFYNSKAGLKSENYGEPKFKER